MAQSPEQHRHRYAELCVALAAQSPAERQNTLRALCAAGTEAPQVLFLLQWRWALPPDVDRDRSGECIGRFTLCEALAEGGGGMVYRAEQAIGPHRREVAVKLLHPTLLATAREEALARFLAEMGLLVRLEHDGIARIYDGGRYEDPSTHDQLPYIAMELVRGGVPITTYARDYALAWTERLALFLRVCRAIQYAHEHRVVHRDLKPANILVDPEGRPVVIDFGLAQASEALFPGAPLAASGTPAYMSPEQVSDAFGAVSAKSDVYALGLILYELLTEQLPYRLPHGGAVEAWRQVILDATPRPLWQYNAAYSEELDAIVAAALAKRPTERLTVAVLRSRLERALQQLLAARDRPLHDTRQGQRDLQSRTPLPLGLPAPPTPLLPLPDTASGPSAARQDSLAAERRQVTLLFCDLVGSTALSGQLDPEDLREVLQAYRETCTGVITRCGGNLDKFPGDGALVCFGYPQAHDDDPQRGVRAGLGIVEAIARVNTRLAQTYSVQLAVRIGIHTGLVVAGALGGGETRDPQAIVGEIPNIAARLQELAAPNTVVCSAATARLVEGYFTLEALGPQGLKGVVAPVLVYRVVGESTAQTRLDVAAIRGLTPLVGRAPEVALLLERWGAATEGRGQVVVLSGEAGIGKSRLVQAVTAQLTGEAYTRIVYHCSPYYQQSPFYPVVAHLQRLLQWRPDDSPAEKLHKLEAALRLYGFALEEVVPQLAALLVLPHPERYPPHTLTTEGQKQQTLELLLAWVLQEAARQPVCVVMEDLHWADPSTLEWLSLLLAQIPMARVLLLLLFRPEFRPPWAGHSSITHLALDRLSTGQTEEMIRQVAGGKPLPAAVVQQVVATTDGVPLFVEELTKIVLESGLVTEREGRYELTGPLSTVAIPTTLHDSLMARLDRLGPAKQVAQLGAIVGREFPYAVLQAVAPLEEGRLQQGLAQLVTAELLYQLGQPPQARYRFKHALIQEAAYQSVLKRTRRLYHQQIAQVLEARYAGRLEEGIDQLAYHYARTDDAAKAVAYLICFAEKLARSYAHVEAVVALQEALVHAERLPAETRDRCRLDLGLRQAHSLFLLGRLQEALALMLQQHEDVERLQEPTLASPYYFWLSHTYAILGDHEQTLQNAQRALEAARRCGDRAIMGKTYYVFAVEDFWTGQHLQGVEHGRQAVSLLEQTGEQYWLGMAHWAVGLNSSCLGELVPALEAAAHAGPIGEAIGDPRLQCYAAWLTGWNQAMRGDPAAGLAACQQALAHAQDPYSTAIATGFLGYAYLEQRDAAAALPLLEQAVQHVSQFRYRRIQGWLTVWLSQAYLLHGHVEQASDMAHQGLEITRNVEFWYGVGLGQRVLGRIAQASGAFPEAQRHLQDAAKTFATIHSRFEAGRTHLDLATLAHAQGNQTAATMHLAEAHALFVALGVPQSVAQTAQFASELGVSLGHSGTC
jgi:serine/threonine protein kinase/tetratricopeptide (TPR) repeat protein